MLKMNYNIPYHLFRREIAEKIKAFIVGHNV